MSRITDLQVRALKARVTRYEEPIGDRLYVEVHPSGKRRFTFRYPLAGRRHKITLEPGITLAAARAVAADMSLELERGIDPKAARNARRGRTPTDSLRMVIDEYFHRVGDKQRSAKRNRRVLELHILPQLGNMPIASLKRNDIIRRCDAIEDNNGAAMADAVLALLGRIMNWHAARSDEFKSPIVKGMARTNARERARERILNDDELRAVWQAADGQFGAMIKFLLLTGARRGEAQRMTKAELAGDTWTLPAARNKVKVDLERPLSGAARAILSPSQCADVRFDGYVFSSDGERPLGGMSRLKASLDARSGVSGWTIHDLRRTSRSLLSRAGVSSDHAERCLGHVLGGVRGVYDRHRYQAEMLHAYEALAALIERIVHSQDNVTVLKGA
jgi:integrase